MLQVMTAERKQIVNQALFFVLRYYIVFFVYRDSDTLSKASEVLLKALKSIFYTHVFCVNLSLLIRIKYY